MHSILKSEPGQRPVLFATPAKRHADPSKNHSVGRPGKSTQKVGSIPKDKHSGLSTERAAKDFGTNRQYIDDAKSIKKESPEKFKEIQTGATLERRWKPYKRRLLKTHIRTRLTPVATAAGVFIGYDWEMSWESKAKGLR